MTDDADADARLAALAARRRGTTRAGTAGVAGDAAPTSAPGLSASRSTRPARRSHAAAGGRLVAAGLSLSAAIVMTGVMARPARTLTATAASPVAAAATPAPVVVHVVLADGSTVANNVPVATTEPAPAPVVTQAPAATRATTASRAS